MRNGSTGWNHGDRLPPHDRDAERAVVGQALLDGKIPTEAQALRASDFYVLRHSQVWAAMRMMEADGIVIDLISVKNALRARDANDSPDRIAAELAANFRDRAEGLLVIRPTLLNEVLGTAKILGSGELLQ